MSIFSSKKKQPDDKSKPQATTTTTTNSNGANGTAKPVKPTVQTRGPPPRNAQPGISQQSGAPLSPAERTAQRAALMAASRQRMNDSSNPDYSISGSFSSSKGRSSHPSEEKAQPVKSSHKTLVKSPEGKKTKGSPEKEPKEPKDSKPSTHFFSAATFSRKSAPPSEHRGSVEKDEGVVDTIGSVEKTPALPSESTAPGYTVGGDDNTSARGQPTPQPSEDSGYGSAARSVVNTSQTDGEAQAAPKARTASLPRVDSGVAPKLNSASTRRPGQEDKSLVAPPDAKTRSRGGSKSGVYVSRLDPGPSGSDFASRLVNFSKPSSEASRLGDSKKPATQTTQSRETGPAPSEQMNSRGRSTAQKPAQSPVAQSFDRPQPQYAQAERSVSSSRSVERPKPYPTQAADTSSFYTAPTGTRTPEGPRTYTPTSMTSAGAEQQYNYSPTAAKSPVSSRFADGATLAALQSKYSDSQRTVDTNPVPNVNHGNQLSYQPLQSPTMPPPNHHTSTSTISDQSARRSTLPPVSALEGYKVNKRGQILDEEGSAIGELFEGDLIDCVRQKVNADGEVIDEFGSVVGRVRPVRRAGVASAVRYSEESQRSAFQSPVYRTPMFSAAASVHRRESNASQMTGMQSPMGMGQQRAVPSGMAAQTIVSPLDGQGNTFIAELDASTEAEAFPIMDHSDIFVPTFGSSQRSQSPSQLMKAELPAVERRRSSDHSQYSDDTPPLEQKPKKWASRYFDPGPNEVSQSPVASRRNSKSPAANRRTSTMDSQFTARRASAVEPVPKRASTMDSQSASLPRRASQSTIPPTPTVPSAPVPAIKTEAKQAPNGYKAVLGPTLEDLAEESPSRSLSATSKASKSTSNLHADAQRLSVANGASPVGSRRASLQMGSSLHPQSARASYAPVRRSPLSNYEATPPGSSSSTTQTAAPSRSPSARAAASVPRGDLSTQRGGEDEDGEDAAPAPDILRSKPKVAGKSEKRGKSPKPPKGKEKELAPAARPGAGNLDTVEKAKVVEKRKSRFSFMR
ncbi:uncharacterized protein LTR77_001731 [Saxophila tyrrhenica]|uniref:Uncharacterized protein n=1 Tax=Saxophila tyrrhenica TaxID=1690608 RepID=A0AAV9PQT4_9PEZI|nr:hypothetical protein LTR77_001731 [Saxophila tyrrhenica]